VLLLLEGQLGLVQRAAQQRQPAVLDGPQPASGRGLLGLQQPGRRRGHGVLDGRDDRSNPRTTSRPARMNIRSAVGAVYQTVTRWSRRIRHQRRASNSAASQTTVTPRLSGAMMPYDVPVTQPGSAVHQNTSPGDSPSA